MWGFYGVAGILSVILTCIWFLAYFRSQFGPFSNEKDWVAGLINIRVHQLLVLSAGTMGSVTCGKIIATGMQFVYLTARMSGVHRKVLAMENRIKERRQSIEGFGMDSFLGLMNSGPTSSTALLPVSEESPLARNRGRWKVLIVQASVGAGHRRAADAIEAVLRQEYSKHFEVHTVDVMDQKFADRVFAFFYKDFYLKLVSGQTALGNMGSLLVGFFFDRSNQMSEGQLTGGGFLNNRRLCMTMTLNFLEFVCEYEPDLIINTHFLAPEIIAGLRRHHADFDLPQVSIVTDMDVHAWWYQEPCEKYFVGRDLCKFQLELHGVDSDRIVVSGIPVMPVFPDMLSAIEDLSVAERRTRFHANMDIKVDLWESPEDTRPVILVMSTGMGVFTLFQELLSMPAGCIICIICGRQADLRGELEKIKVPPHHRACFIPYTTTMHELMGVADVIVTKPGGLITSESLACGLMMVIIDPYAGQEERNAAMLLEAGAAIQVHNYNVIAFRLEQILGNRDILNQYKSKAKLLGAPNAAREIVNVMIDEGLLPCDVVVSEPGSVKHSSAQTGSNFAMQPSTHRGDSPSKGFPGRQRTDSNVSASPLQWFESPEVTVGHVKSRLPGPLTHRMEQGKSNTNSPV